MVVAQKNSGVRDGVLYGPVFNGLRVQENNFRFVQVIQLSKLGSGLCSNLYEPSLH